MKIEQIIPYEKNAKKHPKKQVEQVAASIKAFGFNQPIVLDKNNVIIVGHGRYEAAKLLEMRDVPTISVNLTPEKAKAYRLADNKLNESKWDMDLVIEELKTLSLEQVVLTGFDTDLLLEGDEKDDVLPVKVPARAKLGDLWQLGNHRIMCGDATIASQMERLLAGKTAVMTFTDPPYNIDYQGGMGEKKKNKREGIKNDNMSEEAFHTFLAQALEIIVANTSGGIYVCMSSSELGSLKEAFEEVGGHWSSFIIWVKNHFTLSRSDYQNTYEPILYGWPARKEGHYFVDRRDIANVWEDLEKVKTEFDGKHTTITFSGFKVKIDGEVKGGQVIRKKQHTDIWRYDKPSRSADHPTMKPVALVMEAIMNSSIEGNVVLDPFLGSGTTLIAAEKAGRVCYGMELDPHYVDVIIKRYEEFTNKKAVKIK